MRSDAAGPSRKCKPLLGFDRIRDLAFGRDDHPLETIALGAYCHAAEQQGRNADRWRRDMLAVAPNIHPAVKPLA
ncbi:hypothetical protein GCM10025876_34560 [Demequina litorisediminis]|uniref:Uncharacterized protein n=1 Tax=Demequina litorisediminis TaxID=1849022 RepID=A0ABQ6IKP0_9MICO|nr:hypothetical protein GCM10025876_34560 [Demequina litorisediminis]